jgi:hypothetical protein
MLQVNGAKGLPILLDKLKLGGPAVLYHGALGASAATFIGGNTMNHARNDITTKLLDRSPSMVHDLQRSRQKSATTKRSPSEAGPERVYGIFGVGRI